MTKWFMGLSGWRARAAGGRVRRQRRRRSRLSKADFISQADAICTTAHTKEQAIDFPSVDPHDGDRRPAERQLADAIEQATEVDREEIDDLRKLKPPEDFQRRLRRVDERALRGPRPRGRRPSTRRASTTRQACTSELRRGAGEGERGERPGEGVRPEGLRRRASVALTGHRLRYGSGPSGRIAQRESARFTRGRSLVRSQVRPSSKALQMAQLRCQG